MGQRQKYRERNRGRNEGWGAPAIGPDVANGSNKQEDEEKVEVDDLEGDWLVGLQDDPVRGAEQPLKEKVHLQLPH